jgi:ribosomal-protein-serine acetyltransferase
MPPEIAYSTTLADDRLLLRTFREDDVAGLCEAVTESKKQLIRWMPWCTPDYRRSDTEAFVHLQPQARREGREYSFMILERLSGRVLGGCGLNRIDWLNRYGNLGYWVRSSAAGRGVATGATLLLLGFAFEQLGLLRVEIVAAVGNAASQRVAEKAGALCEGRARNRCRAGGVQHDAFVYSVIPEDVKGKPQ